MQISLKTSPVSDFKIKIQVSKCLVSDSAKEKIIKAGGEVVDVIEVKPTRNVVSTTTKSGKEVK